MSAAKEGKRYEKKNLGRTMQNTEIDKHKKLALQASPFGVCPQKKKWQQSFEKKWWEKNKTL